MECFDLTQIPEELSDDEQNFLSTTFSMGPAVQFSKLHCTACNAHLGSAPIGQFNRFIHPILQVLLCRSCFDFYSSGEFDKDEDGSELYCRWCGQGGKVMCCSDCAFVFCQKCVRQNIGGKALATIRDSADWKCFACNPSQIVKQKVTCYSLFKYTQNEIRKAKEADNTDFLKIDYTTCCSVKLNRVKRKKSIDDEDFEIEPKRKTILQAVLSSFKPGTVVPNPAALKSVHQIRTPISDTSEGVKYVRLKNLPKQNNLRMPFRRGPILMPGTQPRTVMQGGSQNSIPLNKQIVSLPQPSIQKGYQSKHVVVNTVQSILPRGMKHQWFERAFNMSHNIVNNLNKKLSGFVVEQRNAASIEQLATVHNKLQELLSSSVNSLIQVRKNLRNEFLHDLKKIKFGPSSQPALPKAENIPISKNADEDVIIINNDDEDPLNVQSDIDCSNDNPSKAASNGPIPFLKLKPVASLMDKSFFTKQNGKETINLCDDDDVDVIETEIIPDVEHIKEKENVEIINDQKTVPETNKTNIHQNVTEGTFDTDKSEPEPEPLVSELDKETAIQIRRALAESKFEVIIQENFKISIKDDIINSKDLHRMLTVRVNMHPNYYYKPKKLDKSSEVGESMTVKMRHISNKDETTINPSLYDLDLLPNEISTNDEHIEQEDFEEMLGGTILVNNTLRNSNATEEHYLFNNTNIRNDEIDDTEKSGNEDEHSNQLSKFTKYSLKDESVSIDTPNKPTSIKKKLLCTGENINDSLKTETKTSTSLNEEIGPK